MLSDNEIFSHVQLLAFGAFSVRLLPLCSCILIPLFAFIAILQIFDRGGNASTILVFLPWFHVFHQFYLLFMCAMEQVSSSAFPPSPFLLRLVASYQSKGPRQPHNSIIHSPPLIPNICDAIPCTIFWPGPENVWWHLCSPLRRCFWSIHMPLYQSKVMQPCWLALVLWISSVLQICVMLSVG